MILCESAPNDNNRGPPGETFWLVAPGGRDGSELGLEPAFRSSAGTAFSPNLSKIAEKWPITRRSRGRREEDRDGIGFRGPADCLR